MFCPAWFWEGGSRVVLSAMVEDGEHVLCEEEERVRRLSAIVRGTNVKQGGDGGGDGEGGGGGRASEGVDGWRRTRFYEDEELFIYNFM